MSGLVPRVLHDPQWDARLVTRASKGLEYRLSEGLAVTQPPAGWHPDPHVPGQQRYWDGVQWTDQVAPSNAPQHIAATSQHGSPKPVWKRWWFITVVSLIVIGGIGSAMGSGSDSKDASSPTNSEKTTVPTPTLTPTPLTAAQKAAAVKAAKVAAAKAAAKAAFAKKAAAKARREAALAAAAEQAIGAAEDYLAFSAFSKEGLIDQLSSSAGSGFPRDQAVYAVNHIDVDWNQQAVKAAKEYLSFSHFSRAGLIQQLESSAGSKFTHDQAVYGANGAGL